MKKSWPWGLLLMTALTAKAGPPGVPSEPADAENLLAIILTFEQDADEPTLGHTERELEYLFRPFGLQIRWRMGIEDQREEIANWLVSVRMRGRCGVVAAEERQRMPAALALGRTETTDGAPLSYCEIDCDGVRTMIRAAVNRESFLGQQRLLGRALARVLAHEMYHILAGTIQHRRGISKAVLRPDELVGASVGFEPEEVEAIRRHTLPRPLPRFGPVRSGNGW